jgi:hypothetical protein
MRVGDPRARGWRAAGRPGTLVAPAELAEQVRADAVRALSAYRT